MLFIWLSWISETYMDFTSLEKRLREWFSRTFQTCVQWMNQSLKGMPCVPVCGCYFTSLQGLCSEGKKDQLKVCARCDPCSWRTCKLGLCMRQTWKYWKTNKTTTTTTTTETQHSETEEMVPMVIEVWPLRVFALHTSFPTASVEAGALELCVLIIGPGWTHGLTTFFLQGRWDWDQSPIWFLIFACFLCLFLSAKLCSCVCVCARVYILYTRHAVACLFVRSLFVLYASLTLSLGCVCSWDVTGLAVVKRAACCSRMACCCTVFPKAAVGCAPAFVFCVVCFSYLLTLCFTFCA